jgi:hypothetical protein
MSLVNGSFGACLFCFPAGGKAARRVVWKLFETVFGFFEFGQIESDGFVWQPVWHPWWMFY